MMRIYLRRTWSALCGLLLSVLVWTEAMLGFMSTTSMPSSFNALIACFSAAVEA